MNEHKWYIVYLYILKLFLVVPNTLTNVNQLSIVLKW